MADKAPGSGKKSTPPKRSQWTLKGQRITPELRNAVALAAKRKRMTQADFVAEVLTRETQAVLTGNQAEPNRLPTKRIDELEASLVRLTRTVEALAKNTPKSEEAVSPISSLLETGAKWIWGSTN